VAIVFDPSPGGLEHLLRSLPADWYFSADAARGAVRGLTQAVAVGRGVLIESENSYYRQVQGAAGEDSAWTRHHRIAAGFAAPNPQSPPAEAIAIAALHLYRETADLLRSSLLPRHLPVIEATLAAIAASGLISEQ
jgi:hypothetical protein